jgi:hypothetical protein
MKLYRTFSMTSAAIFLTVGILFLAIPVQVLGFFNWLSSPLGFPIAPVMAVNFYLILAVGYMYLVTVIAYLMYRHPLNPVLPLLLAHGKTASSSLSLAFFLLHAHYLIYLVNFLVDGLIGIAVWIFFFKLKKASRA